MVSLDSPKRGIGAGGGTSEGVCVLERCCGVCGRGHGSARHRAVVENVRRGVCEERVVALRANLRAERIADMRRGLSVVNFRIRSTRNSDACMYVLTCNSQRTQPRLSSCLALFALPDAFLVKASRYA